MSFSLPLASGDPVIFLLLAGALLLVGVTIGLGLGGIVLLCGKSEEKKQSGKRLLAWAAVPVAMAVVSWVIVVGLD